MLTSGVKCSHYPRSSFLAVWTPLTSSVESPGELEETNQWNGIFTLSNHPNIICLWLDILMIKIMRILSEISFYLDYCSLFFLPYKKYILFTFAFVSSRFEFMCCLG